MTFLVVAYLLMHPTQQDTLAVYRAVLQAVAEEHPTVQFALNRRVVNVRCFPHCGAKNFEGELPRRVIDSLLAESAIVGECVPKPNYIGCRVEGANGSLSFSPLYRIDSRQVQVEVRLTLPSSGGRAYGKGQRYSLSQSGGESWVVVSKEVTWIT